MKVYEGKGIYVTKLTKKAGSPRKVRDRPNSIGLSAKLIKTHCVSSSLP